MDLEQKKDEPKPDKGYKYADAPRWSLTVNYEVAGVVTKNDVFSVLFSIGKPYGEQMTLTQLSKKAKVGRINLEHFTSRQEDRSRGQAVIPLDVDLAVAALLGGCANRLARVNLYAARFRAKLVPHAELERSLAFADALGLYAEAYSSVEQHVETALSKLKNSTKGVSIVQVAANMWGGQNYRDRQVYLVEGRADVERLCRTGVKNVISIDGKNLAEGTIDYLNSTGQVFTTFFDGDRNGRQLMAMVRSRIRVTYEIVVPKDAKVQSMSLPALRQCLMRRALL